MNKPAMPNWAYNQMIEGLQKLTVLRLQGAPPADAIKAVATVWEEALAPYVWAWQPETDRHRLPEAFRRLMRESERWPAPKMLIERIPPRPQPTVSALIGHQAPKPTQEQRKAAAKIKAQMLKVLNKLTQPETTP